MVHKIKLKKGFKRDLPPLSEAEPGFCTDTGELYVGSSEGNVHINPVKSVNGMTGDVEVTDITGKAAKDSDGNVIKDTYVKKNGDISNTNIAALDAITGEFPVPAAGESTKTFLGKMKKFAQDFNNFKTGIVTLGMLVNNTGTNRADLPAAAGAVFNLQQQVTKVNSDLADEKKYFLHSQDTTYIRGEKIHVSNSETSDWQKIVAKDFVLNDDRSLRGLYSDLAITQFMGDINSLRHVNSNKTKVYYIEKESTQNAPANMYRSAILKISCFGQYTTIELVDEYKNSYHWAGWETQNITSSSWNDGYSTVNALLKGDTTTGWVAIQSGLNNTIYRLQMQHNGKLDLYKSTDSGTTWRSKTIGDASDL